MYVEHVPDDQFKDEVNVKNYISDVLLGDKLIAGDLDEITNVKDNEKGKTPGVEFESSPILPRSFPAHFPILQIGSRVDPDFSLRIVAVPFPGRGHVNPLLKLCKIIATTRPDFLITFVVTEEWLGYLSSDSKPANVRFGAIPNVIPSERIRAKDYSGFIQAVYSKMEAPVDRLLDSLEPPPASVIITDVVLSWVLGLGRRRNIPVASLWTQSATLYSIYYHHQLLIKNGHFGADLSEKADELIDYIPGVPSMQVKDLPDIIHGRGPSAEMRSFLFKILSTVINEAQYLLLTSIADLESPAIEALKAKLPTPVYSIGPAIPYDSCIHGNAFGNTSQIREDYTGYLPWLDLQPACSVLYISQGSFLSFPDEQLDEIIGGVHDSGVCFIWVAHNGAERLKEGGHGGRGLVVPWCDQLRVLCHPSVGGFWSHCGWNSIKEGVFAGVPFLTFPIAFDQVPNCKHIVEDWKIGWRVKKEFDGVVTRGEISQLLRRFLDSECDESKELRKRAKQIGEMCRQSIKGGLAMHDLENFIDDISRSHNP